MASRAAGPARRSPSPPPAGGTHPFAAEARADLTVTAWGRWQGRPTWYAETVDNDGCARISHGHVFRL